MPRAAAINEKVPLGQRDFRGFVGTTRRVESRNGRPFARSCSRVHAPCLLNGGQPFYSWSSGISANARDCFNGLNIRDQGTNSDLDNPVLCGTPRTSRAEADIPSPLKW